MGGFHSTCTKDNRVEQLDVIGPHTARRITQAPDLTHFPPEKSYFRRAQEVLFRISPTPQLDSKKRGTGGAGCLRLVNVPPVFI